MNPRTRETREPLADGITPAEIQKLIAERKGTGATSCEVVTENGNSILVCQYPPL